MTRPRTRYRDRKRRRDLRAAAPTRGARAWGADVRWGVAAGACFAALYSGMAVVLYVLAGPAQFGDKGLTLRATVAAYAAGGLAGGALVGLLRPLARWRAGAMLVGVAAAVPLTLALTLAMRGHPAGWSEDVWGGGALAAVALGLGCGFIAYEPPDAGRGAPAA